MAGLTLFDTAIGRCGIAWGERGVTGVRLPPASGRSAPAPSAVQAAIDGIVALLDGEAVDLSYVVLDFDDVPLFDRRVYEVARTIAPGRTLSYGEVATRICDVEGTARDVGQALGRNPFPLVVPCHRVLAADGTPGGFSAPGGTTTKLRLLAIEGSAPPAQLSLGL